MKYLEDTLAEQCLSKTLYPNTKIIVTRKKVEGTLLTYTNELEVKVDFSDVDPSLLENMSENEPSESKLSLNSVLNKENESPNSNKDLENEDNLKSTISGKAARFFRK